MSGNELWTAGGKCVVLGDAITLSADRRGGFMYRLREQIVAAYGEGKVELLTVARAGDRVPDLAARLEKDVLPLQPKVVVAVLGVTDIWYAARGTATPIDDYVNALERMAVTCRQHSIALWFCTPMLIGERTKTPNSFDSSLAKCAAAVREVAAKHGCSVIDLFERAREELRQTNIDNRAHGRLTIDGIHPNDQGARLIASAIAEGLGFDASRGGERRLRHVVLFKYKPEVTVEQIRGVEQSFRNLADVIPGIIGFECGTDNSPEGLSQGFTHAYIVTFSSEAARSAYLPHSAHMQFVSSVKPLLAGVLVVDFWADIAASV